MDTYGGLAVLILGGICNSLTLIILSKKSMRQNTINICLIAMTTDPDWPSRTSHDQSFHGDDPTFKSSAYCKFWVCMAGYTVTYSTHVLVGKDFVLKIFPN